MVLAEERKDSAEVEAMAAGVRREGVLVGARVVMKVKGRK